MYRIKEIYFTQQGEGANTGKDFVFIRFSGCNLWSGKESNRASAICKFCDTDFYGTEGVNGGVYQADKLIEKVKSLWLSKEQKISVVLTGGEPLLQADQNLIDTLKSNNIFIAIETNGTLLPPQGIDWICMSPKANTDIKLRRGNELKIVFPQEDIDPLDFSHYEYDYFFIQPMDSKNLDQNINQSVSFCRKHPSWELSLQTHKILGIR